MLLAPPCEITVPGSKSIANRALILNFLCGNKTEIINIPKCDDCEYLVKALVVLGQKRLLGQQSQVQQRQDQQSQDQQRQDQQSQDQHNHENSTTPLKLYTGNAGTATRFLTALCTLLPFQTSITGNERMQQRPIQELINALVALGAKIDCPSGCPPIKISPQVPQGGQIKLKGNISSQYLSAILMISPFLKKNTEIEIIEELYSKPYVDITLKIMASFGLKVENEQYKTFKISGRQSPTPPEKYTIESDASSASYLGAYSALNSQKQVALQTLSTNSIQGDIKFLDYLKEMGCQIIQREEHSIVQGPKALKSLNTVDMNSTPDLVMTFAILSLFADGPCKIINIANLRIKETDRITALETELKKLGAKVITSEDSIKIFPLTNEQIQKLESNSTKPISIKTYDDHRIAMCFAILNDRFPCLEIQDKECVSKSYPEFWQDLEKLQNSAQEKSNIILIGLRGSGKTQIGQLLKKKLKLPLIDLDQEIEKKQGKSIKQIVEEGGWEYFRELEQEITAETSKLKNTIIATGGGTIMNKNNLQKLKNCGTIIYLYRDPEDCLKYINADPNRPALLEGLSKNKEMKSTFKERHPQYEKAADIIIKRNKNLKKDAEEIINKITPK